MAAALIVGGGISRHWRRFHSSLDVAASVVGGGIVIGYRRRRLHSSEEAVAYVVGGGRSFIHWSRYR